MSPEKKLARRYAQARAAERGLTVYKLREHRELPMSYFAAATRDQALVMLVRSYRPWPRRCNRA